MNIEAYEAEILSSEGQPSMSQV